MAGNFSCDLCGGTYTSKRNLLQHFTRVSCKNMAVNLAKKKKEVEIMKKRKKHIFACQLCPDIYYVYSSSLRKHMKNKHDTSTSSQSALQPTPPPPGTDYKVVTLIKVVQA